jgi:hypothetical protein
MKKRILASAIAGMHTPAAGWFRFQTRTWDRLNNIF